ncbi:TPA: peptidoglycan DD-metalloendopeptidase family protein [Corynebacterium striatum]|nr:peptidoglycan DD-metalloendopeptidase family protein [Corynebacterium striatum]HAT6493877.1 peptidoglycan DD-metalloendopeptidase family protein [Corynebacterium striatum]HAT6496189.1 peptidoglycan DD-metalloendopeptidase family protein [Corynebacterium striatum]HAT6620107.1 peptidoglycan DD-metalloendopeptidase family protein [Corynebacterium striatum]
MVTHPMRQGTYRVSSGYGPRWGSFHAGLDFAAPVGTPIYAAADGVVVEGRDRRNVDGFGSWIWLDCQDSVGKDFIYGHVKHSGILVKKGDRVRAGQQIGVVGNEGQSTGPHLHFEVWGHPGRLGGAHQDPARYLQGAAQPGETKPVQEARPKPKPKGGTIYGIDISEHNDGLSCARAKQEGIEFAIIRLCDGTHVDRVFHSHLADAEQAGMLVSTYWYLRAPSEGTSISQQVDVIDRQMGGRRDLPVWIDVESVDMSYPAGDPRRNLLVEKDVWDAKRELERRGYHVPGIYTGRWYWENMRGGEPSMNGLGYLWVSNYGLHNGAGDPRSLYASEGGDRHPGWDYPLGDRKPDLLQYGSWGTVAGRPNVDINAYRGTRAELEALFTGKQEELSMADIQRILDHIDRKTEETKRYVDIRITDPIGSDVKDIRQQLTGGRDKIVREDGTVDIEASYPGWKHLAVNGEGKGITPVDALALMIQILVRIERKLDQLLGGKR